MNLDGVPLGVLTPSALLSIVVLMILTGRLIPRRTYDDMMHDRDEWRAAHRISETARVESVSQVDELLEHSRTTSGVLDALRAAALREDTG